VSFLESKYFILKKGPSLIWIFINYGSKNALVRFYIKLYGRNLWHFIKKMCFSVFKTTQLAKYITDVKSFMKSALFFNNMMQCIFLSFHLFLICKLLINVIILLYFFLFSSPGVSHAGGQAAPQRPPRFELDGKKWAIEYYKNHPGLSVENTDMNQSVYVYR